MNVIGTVKEILTNCELMDRFNQVHIDYSDDENPGLIPTISKKIGEDVIGNEKYSCSFQLISPLTVFEDYERLNNSDFLLSLTYFLNHQRNIHITETMNSKECKGIITKMDAGNGMLFSIPSGDINDGVRYQLQITVNYTVYAEE